MANPPFNVDGIRKDDIAGDKRFLLGIPRNDNGNYLWIQMFGLAQPDRPSGLSAANSAGDAGIQNATLSTTRPFKTDADDAIGTNFFYTVTLPVTLWFLDNSKKGSEREDRKVHRCTQSVPPDRPGTPRFPARTDHHGEHRALYRGGHSDCRCSDDLMATNFPDGVYVDVPGCARSPRSTKLKPKGGAQPGCYTEQPPKKTTALTSMKNSANSSKNSHN